MRPLPPWVAAFAAVPFTFFIYWAFRALGQSAKMINEINTAVPPEKQFMYYGLGQIMAWRTYQRLFPGRTDLPRKFRAYAIRTLAAFVVTIGFVMLLTAFIP